jgi:hypothetical protein
MGTPSQYYVDPSGGSDATGDGAIGNPWQTVQHALDTITRDSTHGDQINVRDTADDVLSGTLDLTSYGSASAAAPLVFRGYTSAAKDGGKGGMSGGGGGFPIWSSSQSYVYFIDMHLHNVGAASIVEFLSGGGNYQGILNCEVDNGTGSYAINLSTDRAVCINNHVHNFGGVGIFVDGDDTKVCDNYLANGANDFSYAIHLSGYGTAVLRNIISVDGAAYGIYTDGIVNCLVAHNSVRGGGSTGAGFYVSNSNAFQQTLTNNVVAGFSGAGGAGIRLANSSRQYPWYAGNACWNNATNYADVGDEDELLAEDNEELASHPFDESGSDTFANRFTYFAPTSAVQGTAWPSGCRLDKGAVQHADPAGGSAIIIPRPRRVM